jgi:hypothetical protein
MKRRRRTTALEGAVAFAIIMMALLFGASGCTLLAGPIDRAADRTAAAVNLYCDNFTPDQRVYFGDRVRMGAAPDSITVDCG